MSHTPCNAKASILLEVPAFCHVTDTSKVLNWDFKPKLNRLPQLSEKYYSFLMFLNKHPKNCGMHIQHPENVSATIKAGSLLR